MNRFNKRSNKLLLTIRVDVLIMQQNVTNNRFNVFFQRLLRQVILTRFYDGIPLELSKLFINCSLHEVYSSSVGRIELAKNSTML